MQDRQILRIRFTLGIVFAVYLAILVVSISAAKLLHLRYVPAGAPGCSYEDPTEFFSPIRCKGFAGSSVTTALMDFPLVFFAPVRAFAAMSSVIHEEVATLLMVVFWVPVIHAVFTIVQVRRARRENADQ